MSAEVEADVVPKYASEFFVDLMNDFGKRLDSVIVLPLEVSMTTRLMIFLVTFAVLFLVDASWDAHFIAITKWVTWVTVHGPNLDLDPTVWCRITKWFNKELINHVTYIDGEFEKWNSKGNSL